MDAVKKVRLTKPLAEEEVKMVQEVLLEMVRVEKLCLPTMDKVDSEHTHTHIHTHTHTHTYTQSVLAHQRPPIPRVCSHTRGIHVYS